MLQNVLVIDIDRLEVERLREALGKGGCRATAAYGLNEARRKLSDKAFGAVVAGAKIVAEMRHNIFDFLRAEVPDAAVVVLTAPEWPKSLGLAAEKCGFRTLAGPAPDVVLLDTLRELAGGAAAGGAEPAAPAGAELLGEGAAMRRLREMLFAAAASDATVLLRGETGTGKELAARFIHARSARAHARLVAVNCAALAETLLESELFGHEKGAFTGAWRQKPGKFEYAGKGTIFLDEIGEMPPHLQAKMLRLIDYREFERVGGNRALPVQCRVIAASNIDFAEALRTGRFREDLYYRLNVMAVDLPPLRERREDIPLLARHFLERAAARRGRKTAGFSAAAADAMRVYHWPGNVRELENMVERAVILAPPGSPVNLPALLPQLPARDPRRPLPPPADIAADGEERPTLRAARERAVAQCEKAYLERLLTAHRGHICKTAAAAGIDRKTFYRKIRQYGITPAAYKIKKSR